MANLADTTPVGNGFDRAAPPLIDDKKGARGPQPATVARTIARLWHSYDTHMARLRALHTRKTLGSDGTMLKRTAAMVREHNKADEILGQIVLLEDLQGTLAG